MGHLVPGADEFVVGRRWLVRYLSAVQEKRRDGIHGGGLVWPREKGIRRQAEMGSGKETGN